MSTLIKVQDKGQVTIPSHIRSKAGLMKGDLVEAAFERGKIVLTPKAVIDRSQFPNADDEYTPAERRATDARLAEGLADIKAGRTHGPFGSVAEMVVHMKARSSSKKKAPAKAKKRRR